MEELRELVYILTQSAAQDAYFTSTYFGGGGSKMQQLFDAIQKEEVTDDQEAVELIYGEQRITSKYRNLKYELKKRLLDALLLVKPSGGKGRNEAYYQCWKEWAACQILIEKSARTSAKAIAQRLLRKAVQYDFLSLVVNIALFLRNHYALRERNRERFEYFDELYERYQQEEAYNNLAHKYYMRLILDHAQDSVIANPQIEADAQRYLEELTPLKDQATNAKFYYYLYQVQLLGKMGVFNYQEARDICAEAIAYLDQSNFEFKGGALNFLLNKLVCHIQLGEFEEGKKTAIACSELVEEGTFNWFKTQEYLFLLSAHTRNYQSAYDSYYAVVNHPRYNAYTILHETWSLYKMYLHFLYLLGKFELAAGDRSFSKVRLGKFLNETPSFAKDKQGMNIPVLIIQMAFLILQHKYDLAVERIDALNKYCDRYLRGNDPNFRCNCFIKMLLEIPKSAFHRNGAERRAQRYLKRMKTTAINFSSQAHELEILPFEDFWYLILQTLDNKFYEVKQLR